ncbi:hypothetical protein RND71_017140 [Anisodus tanguticus]|uniref:Hydroxyphenylpyruvate reductase n=1 Tax=Anisodus tanguticus TaxID=243964 RepID=A0AAE1VHY6_9SOLA|nr:hypothetical protein RND71_017140 [Anisodus tanguticus]
MNGIGVLLMRPLSNYIQQELAKRFTLFKYWEIPSESLKLHSDSIRAVVGNGVQGANSELIDALPRLEIISSHSSGLDKIDLVKCKERGIRVTSTPDALTDDVADMAILLTLATLRRIRIVGLGRIGSAIAKRAEAFGCSISYHSRSQKPDSTYTYYPRVIDLASNCQILVIACALTDESHHSIDRDVIDALGPNGVVINIARGSYIDAPELVSALAECMLRGAGLDVLEHEPEVPVQLARLDNVVLSPHTAAGTLETCKDMTDLVVANLEAYFSNKPLLPPVL